MFPQTRGKLRIWTSIALVFFLAVALAAPDLWLLNPVTNLTNSTWIVSFATKNSGNLTLSLSGDLYCSDSWVTHSTPASSVLNYSCLGTSAYMMNVSYGNHTLLLSFRNTTLSAYAFYLPSDNGSVSPSPSPTNSTPLDASSGDQEETTTSEENQSTIEPPPEPSAPQEPENASNTSQSHPEDTTEDSEDTSQTTEGPTTETKEDSEDTSQTTENTTQATNDTADTLKNTENTSEIIGVETIQKGGAELTVPIPKEASGIPPEEAISVDENQTNNTKKITISSPIHYKNITIRTSVPDVPNGSIHIYRNVNGSRVQVPFRGYDTNNNTLIDEVEWVVPHLSTEDYIIIITRAAHLDSNRNFVSDIYDAVREHDDIWSEAIPDGHYIRVSFERNLTSKNDITLYARSNSGATVTIYREGGSTAIATIDIGSAGFYKAYLSNMQGESATFDLLVSGSAEVDYIVDPPLSSCGTISSPGYYQLTTDVSSAGTCFTIAADDVTIDCAGHTITYGTSSSGNAVVDSGGWNNLVVSNCTITAVTSGGSAIYIVGATGCEISHNTITPGAHGIYLDSGVSHTLIDSNNITTSSTANSRYGIYFNSGCSHNNITNTRVTTSTQNSYGIYLDSGSNYNIISDTYVKTTGSSASAIYLKSSSNHNSILNTTVETFGQSSYGLYFYQSSYTNVHGSHITTRYTGNDAWPVNLQSSSYNVFDNTSIVATGGSNTEGFNIGGNYNDIQNCTINSPSSAIYATHLDHTNFCNNTITTTTSGAYAVRITSSAYATNFTNNRIYPNSAYDIYAASAGGASIKVVNNTFTSWGFGISDAPNSIATNNTGAVRFSSSSNTRIWNNYGYIEIGSGSNYRVYNNTYNGGGTGIGVYGSTNSIIANNTITSSWNNADYGALRVESSASNNRIYNNTIIATSGTNAIRLYSAVSNRIYNNTLIAQGTNGRGIYMRSGSNQNYIANNTIITTGRSGVGIGIGSSDQNIFENLSITTTGWDAHGILFDWGSSEYNILRNLTIEASGGIGIHIRYPVRHTVISPVTIISHNREGIYGENTIVSNLTIQNDTITSGSNYRGIFFYYFDHTLFTNNTINSGREGIYINSRAFATNFTNNIINSYGYGIVTKAGGVPIHIVNNTASASVSNAPNSIATNNTGHIGFSSSSNTRIWNNYGRIDIGSGSNYRVYNNTYNGGSIGIYISGATNSVIANNTIISSYNGNYGGLDIRSGSTDNEIYNNTIHMSSGAPAIRLQDSDRNHIYNDSITTTGSGGGIYLVSSDRNTFENLSIRTTYSNAYGIYFSTSVSDSNIIKNLTITTSGGNARGINFASYASHTIINRVNITANNAEAIYSDNSGTPNYNVIQNSTITTGASYIGIRLYNDDHVLFLNNTINSGHEGIYIYGTGQGTNFTNNTINNGYGYGIVTNGGGTSIRIVNNTASASVSNAPNSIATNNTGGIYFSSSDNSHIYGNTGAVGIGSGSNYQVYRNTYNGGGTGIGVYGSTNSIIANNTITSSWNNAGYGALRVESSASNNRIYNNTVIATSGTNALHLYSAVSNRIYNNTLIAQGTNGKGIYMRSGSNQNYIANNTIITTGTNGDGILFSDGSSSNIFYNDSIELHAGGACGMHFYGGSASNNNQIINCSIESFSSYPIRFQADSTGTIIKNSTVIAHSANVPALEIQSGQVKLSAYNTVFEALAYTYDIKADQGWITAGSWINFTNVTFSGIILDTSQDIYLNVSWYLDVYVNDSMGNPRSDATVMGWNKDDVLRFSKGTNANGWIAKTPLLQYHKTRYSTTYYTPYTVNATVSESGFSEATDTTDLTDNTVLNLTVVDILPPSISLVPPTPDNNTAVTDCFQINSSIIEAYLDNVTYKLSTHSTVIYSFETLDDGLVLMFNFDNETAYGENNTHVFDFSGNENNGTVIGDGDEITENGWYKGATDLDGNDYIEVNTLSSIGISQVYWAKSSTDTNWHQYINSSGTTYKDGVASSWSGNLLSNSSGVLRIGEGFVGRIDEVRIYNRSLSSSDVEKLYNYTYRRYPDLELHYIRYNTTNSSIWLQLNYTNGTQYTLNITQCNLTNGVNYAYNLTAFDKTGNSNSTETRYVITDVLPPSVSFVDPTPSNGSAGFRNVNINWTAVDNVDNNVTCVLFVNNISQGLFYVENGTSANYSTQLNSGLNNFSVWCWDDAGNNDTSGVYYYTGAQIDITSPTSGEVVLQTQLIRINVTVLDAEDYITNVTATLYYTFSKISDTVILDKFNATFYNTTYTMPNYPAQEVNLTAYAFNETDPSVNVTDSISFILTNVGGTPKRQPVLKQLCSNTTYAINNTPVVITADFYLNTLLQDDHLTVYLPNGSTVTLSKDSWSLKEESYQGRIYLYELNYSYTPTITGNFTLSAYVEDVDGESLEANSTMYVSTPELVSWSSPDISLLQVKDVCSGNVITSGASVNRQMPSLRLYDLEINLTNEPKRLYFYDADIPDNTSSLVLHTDSFGECSPPAGERTIDMFDLAVDLNFSTFTMIYDYSEAAYTIVAEESLSMFSCNDTASCDFVEQSITIDTENDTVNLTKGGVDARYVLTEPITQANPEIITQTRTQTEQVIQNQTVEMEVSVPTRVSLSILTPEKIDINDPGETRIPITLKNDGDMEIQDILLSATSNASSSTVSLSIDKIDSLSPGSSRDLELVLDNPPFSGDLEASYTVRITATSSNPQVRQQASIPVLLYPYLTSTREQLQSKMKFAVELLNRNPSCLELSENLDYVRTLIQKGEYEKANKMLDDILRTCREEISNSQSLTLSTPTGAFVSGEPNMMIGVLVGLSVMTLVMLVLFKALNMHIKKK